MKTKLTILFICVTLSGYSQTELLKSSISNGGANTEVGTIKLIYSIGENAIQETEVGALQLSEGFINSVPVGVVLGTEDFLELTGITAYPNPTVDYINLEFKELSNYDIMIFDMVGKQLGTYKTATSHFKIDMNSYSNGVYFINIKDNVNKQFKVFRIIKN